MVRYYKTITELTMYIAIEGVIGVGFVDRFHQGKVLRRFGFELTIIAGARQAEQAALAAHGEVRIGRLDQAAALLNTPSAQLFF